MGSNKSNEKKPVVSTVHSNITDLIFKKKLIIVTKIAFESKNNVYIRIRINHLYVKLLTF
jgi:hypothetical protein